MEEIAMKVEEKVACMTLLLLNGVIVGEFKAWENERPATADEVQKSERIQTCNWPNVCREN